MKTLTTIFRGLLSLAVLVATTPEAMAYGWNTCDGSRLKWNNQQASMYISTVSFPADTVWDRQLQSAMWRWNNVKGSTFDFYVGRDTDGRHGSGNGLNEVALQELDGPGGTLAVTRRRYRCELVFLEGWEFGIEESDVIFDVSEDWSFYPSYEGTGIDFEGVALHEFGHAAGLNHEDRLLATMNSYYPNGGSLGSFMEWDALPDDRAGLRYLYGDSTHEVDMAASTYVKYPGLGALVMGPPAFTATAGDSLEFRYTVGNLGTRSATMDVGFYVSADPYIDANDIRVGGTVVSADPAAVGTLSVPITLPTWLATGSYYLGFVIDPDNLVAEANEWNNFQHNPNPIAITALVPPDTTPEPFAFEDRLAVARASEIISNTILVTGIDTPTDVQVEGGEYSIGCSGTFTMEPGIVENGTTLCVRHWAAEAYETEVQTTLAVGGVSATFRSMTEPEPPARSSGGGGSLDWLSLLGLMLLAARTLREIGRSPHFCRRS